MDCLYGVYGASGCARSLMPVAIEQLKREGLHEKAQIVFIDDALEEEQLVNSYIAMNYQKFKSTEAEYKKVLIAIANSTIREKIANKLAADNISVRPEYPDPSDDKADTTNGCDWTEESYPG